jgi:hypothetical protein
MHEVKAKYRYDQNGFQLLVWLRSYLEKTKNG